ncbi:glucocorticoid modulatory element-binding protein 1-like, partial [Sardina pilchardus]|uniref:glucocorticoid modulatory element-binding protein 1-like n=1 Tax=Sardina pilchardus TaxID=27697 RepID=UPI002E12F370
MANAGVPMSMGDMLVVKGEEGDTITGHKAQVILHLQSISQGANDDIADTSTTVLAVETHQEDSSTDGEEVEYGYPITCGDSRAVLLYKKFVCPGINVKCVKFNDQLISPKQFVQLAGKSTLKDWKRAIRLGGVMLRKMMDSGQIDFYQHDTVCTNSCRSTKFDLLINSTRLPSMTTPTSPLPGGGGQMLFMEDKSEDSGSVMMEARASHMIPVQSQANGDIKKEAEDPDESLSFWQGLSELGLVGEVVSSIRTELLALLRGVEQRGEQALLHHTDAAVLSTLTQMFGLLDSVRQVLDLQRSRTSQNEDLLHNRLDVLECQLDNQKRQPLDWRTHPSSPFPIIVHTPLEATPFCRPPFGKRPRLQRSTSTSSALFSSASSGTASSGSPFTVLSPITFSPVGQTLSVPGLPISSLAQLPTGSQLFPLHSASGGYRGKAEAVVGVSPASGLSLPGAAHLRPAGAFGAVEERPPSRGEMQEREDME